MNAIRRLIVTFRAWFFGLSQRRAMLAAAALVAGALSVFAILSVAAQEQRFPDVVAVKVQPAGENKFDFDVKVSSPYDTPKRYADGFRVVGKNGKLYGERKLLHDHADEQPFTRGFYAVPIPPGVKTVVIQARDQKHGYGGRTVSVDLPRR